jgi:hypothetical protein
MFADAWNQVLGSGHDIVQRLCQSRNVSDLNGVKARTPIGTHKL